MTPEEALAKIKELTDPQWRTVPTDLPEVSMEAFSMGRNWMIDRIREVLAEVVETKETKDLAAEKRDSYEAGRQRGKSEVLTAFQEVMRNKG